MANRLTSIIPNCPTPQIIICIFLFLFWNTSICSSKNYALLIGLKNIDQSHFKKFYDPEATSGVPKDIAVIRERLNSMDKYDIMVLEDNQATVVNIIGAIKKIGSKVNSGDGFVLYFSCHGDTIRDVSGDEVETHYDEVFVAWDGYLLDDRVDELYQKYFTKTKNVMLVDACHSSTSFKLAFLDFSNVKFKSAIFAKALEVNTRPITTSIDPSTCQYVETFKNNSTYSLVYFGATRDDAEAFAGITGGLFTAAIEQVFIRSKVTGRINSLNYRQLGCLMASILRSRGQELQYHEIGPAVNDFSKNIPFTFNR
jgi:hypothetical protein